MVEKASLVREPNGRTVEFRVTDGKTNVLVTYSGALPDLFREGQGVVAEGRLRPSGIFAASTVLAKHDEKYMPPEVAEALKKAGRWKEGSIPDGKPLALPIRARVP
jgi:cytochrome c-type biogenesis protein CcmE